MKRSFNFALMLVLFAAPAFAGSKHTTVDIPEKVQIGSAQVAAGQYELTWMGSGSNVQATLTQNQKAVVTFSARMVERKGNAGVETDGRGGVATLDVIDTDNFKLILESAAQSGQ